MRVIKIISRLLFFIIVTIYIFVFIFSLDSGSELGLFNILSSVYGNAFFGALVILSLLGSAAIYLYLNKKLWLTNNSVLMFLISFVIAISIFIIFIKNDLILDWLCRIYVSIFDDDKLYSGSGRLLQHFPFIVRVLFFFMIMNIFSTCISYSLLRKYKLR